MRIFVAIPIYSELQELILNWAEKHGNLPVRWLKGKNLHVTLVPPWETGEPVEIISKLKQVESSTFNIFFENISFGPHPQDPRLIWARGKSSKEIDDLRSKIYGILGQAADPRPFKLHATFARFRPENFKNFAIKTLNEQVNWQQKVNSFVLMRSHLSPSGADYEVLKEFLLHQ